MLTGRSRENRPAIFLTNRAFCASAIPLFVRLCRNCTDSFGEAGLSLTGLEELVEALFFGEAELGAQPVAGAVDARARNVQAGGYFLCAVLKKDQHTEYHVGVGKRRVITAQVVDKTRINGNKGSPERPEIIFKSLRTMENVGIYAAGHLVSDDFYALKGGIALVEGGTDAGFSRFAARAPRRGSA